MSVSRLTSEYIGILPCLLSVSDELHGTVVVVVVAAVLVAHRFLHFLHRHRALAVDLGLRHGQVVVELNLIPAAWSRII